MKRLTTLLFLTVLLSIFTFSSCDEGECHNVVTDPSANLDEFLGLWYEIGSIPQFFSSQCSCTTAEYTLQPDGTVQVNNNCRVFGAPINIQGSASPADPSDFSKLEVVFPVSQEPGEYWIMLFNPEDGFMLVGDSVRSQLYVLSRTPTLDTNIYEQLMAVARLQCFDTTEVELTDQSCNL